MVVGYSLSVTCDRSVVFYSYSVSSTNKTYCNDIAEILLKVAFNTLSPNYEQYSVACMYIILSTFTACNKMFKEMKNHISLKQAT
jgi:hypothetical protein